MSTVKKVSGIVVVGLLVAAFGAQSAFATEPFIQPMDIYGTDCFGPDHHDQSFTDFNQCGVVTNRVLGFNTHGGQISSDQTLTVTSFAGTKAHHQRGSMDTATAWNASAWQWFQQTGGEVGVSHFSPTGGALTAPVAVDFNWMNMNGLADGTYTMTCPEQAYLVCQTPAVFSHKVNRHVRDITGFASIESRPLIVKIINQTDQPLVRSSEARTTGLLRDDQVADPATINAMHNGHVGNGYYHFYRDSSKANNATVSYTFGAGSEGTALTHGVIDIDIVVDEAGTTTTSTCRAPEGLDVTVQCAVTMIGSADGILTAIVSIGA